MFKTAFHVCLTVHLVSAALAGTAARAPQSAFKVFNAAGSAGKPSRATPSVAPPVLAFVVDSAHRLRPLIGITGSAQVGTPLDLGFEVVQAVAAPGHEYILAMTPGGGWPRLLQVRGDTITVESFDAFAGRSTLPLQCYESQDLALLWAYYVPECWMESSPLDNPATIDRIAVSPAGSAAAFFSESQGRVYAFAGLSQQPVLLGHVEVGGLGPLTAFGISDDGQTVVFGVSDGQAGSVFVGRLDRAPRLIAAMRRPAVIQFLHRTDSAIVADDEENRIYALSGEQLFTIATAEAGISGPAGLAASYDNQTIFVANSKSGSVVAIRPYGTAIEPASCNCRLTGLHPTNADSVFRLTDFSDAPVLFFDGNRSAPRMFFVQAPQD